jgi:hypothetical protein
MYEILPETKGHLIALKAMGKLTDIDFELLQADLDKLLASAAPARISIGPSWRAGMQRAIGARSCSGWASGRRSIASRSCRPKNS